MYLLEASFKNEGEYISLDGKYIKAVDLCPHCNCMTKTVCGKCHKERMGK